MDYQAVQFAYKDYCLPIYLTTMSAAQDQQVASTKKFGKGERQVPAASQKASKYYPAEDTPQPRKVGETSYCLMHCSALWL